jgi:uncharacterized membrane protein YdjX (TVP38/TMEM64 family)
MPPPKRRVVTFAACCVLVCLVGAAVWSYRYGGVVDIILRRDITSAERIAMLQQYIQSWGIAGPLVYVLIIAIEVVVAPIPGAMLYAPGGVLFGGFWGGFLSLIGNVLGAGIACRLMQLVGRSRLEWMWEADQFQSLDGRLARAGVWVIAALRVNPITSSDLVSYAAGLTSIPTWKVMLGTLIGMAPLCWAQAYLADELLTAFPHLIYAMIVACLVYAIVAAITLRRVMLRRQAAG